MSNSSGGKPTIRAGRRRTSSQQSGSDRRRAQAPDRQTSASSGGSRPGSSLPALGGGRGRPTLLGIVLMVLILCVFFGYQLLSGGGDEGFSPSDQDDSQAESLSIPTNPPLLATSTPRPAEPAPGGSTGSAGTWTVMLYQDADDKVLEQDIYVDLNEAERTGSTGTVKILSQVDRFRGAYQGDGDWSSTRRYLVTRDQDLNRVASELLADLGETNMSDPQTLIDFVTWAVDTYPADRYALILSDHGMGWPGGWSDPDPQVRGDSSIPLASRLGNQLYLHQLDEALSDIRTQTGIEKFDLIGMDACLMGQVEVFSMLAPHAYYAVASQEVEPALGWAYTGFLDQLVADPGMDGEQLSRYIVESYIQDDQRILDDQARSEMLRQGSIGGMFGLLGQPTANQIARQMGATSTLTAVNLEQMPTLINSLNDLAFLLQQENQAVVARARNYAQSFTNIFGSQVPPSYIDLGNFLSILDRESGDPEVGQAVDRLGDAASNAILVEKHGSKIPGATGLSIYFPNSTLYRNAFTGPQSYTAIASRFAGDSLWDDFLSFHYTNQSFAAQPQPPLAQPVAGVRAPGAGDLRISPLELSASDVAPGQSVLMSADVGGDNIGHIYLYVGFYDQDANSIFVADMDFLETEPTREVGGVYYPTWSEADEFRLEFEWEPVVFNITDGNSSFTALFKPQSYGATSDQAIYTVDGVYEYADGSGSINARLVFSDGILNQVLGISGDGDFGAPREIIPSLGDQFTIMETWLDLDEGGNIKEQVQQPGGRLTFGSQTFSWEELDAAAGAYVIGFIVEDMDGGKVQTFSQVTVR